MHIIYSPGSVVLKDTSFFDLDQTFDCGQCFRWHPSPEGGYVGVVGEKVLHIIKKGDDIVLFTDAGAFDDFWRDYFDLDRDYSAVRQCLPPDETLRKAMDYAPGIRILKQPFFETLITFILSQNSNIPRIRKMVETLCSIFGRPVEYRGKTYFTFPEPEILADADGERLALVRAGYRTPFILDAAKRVALGELKSEELRGMELKKARELLCTVKGIGPKVADCVLLYGAGRMDAFPIDVWMKRILDRCYGGDMPACFARYGGLIQQYLFYYSRNALGKG